MGLALLSLFVFSTAAQADEWWADSLATQRLAKAPAEASLQYLLDSLGYDIDVANDELGIEVLCGQPGDDTATMILEVAGSAVYATSGYYEAGDTWPRYQLFGPSNVPGDTVVFSVGAFDSVGFWMKPNYDGNYTWYSEEEFNSDDFDHVWIFSTGVPHEYLIAFEDLNNGGDADYQDLVIKVRFANKAPHVVLPPDSSVVTCSSDSICFDLFAYDNNCQGDSIWLTMLSGEGVFAPQEGLSSITTSHCFLPSGSGTYEFVFQVEDIVGAIDIDTFVVTVAAGSAPVVAVSDTTVDWCELQSICLPLSIFDPDCDIVSVTTNLGSYGGNASSFDQIARYNELGATILQVGGGAPGQTLIESADFVGPVNSQSGVNVTLPNFAFATTVHNTGSFPVGPGLFNSSDNLLGAPTDLTFTLPGPGGPDGGAGDGSIDFSSGQYVCIGFGQDITTCNGAEVDFILFTNTAASGNGTIQFRDGGAVVHTYTGTIPGGSAGSGTGGLTLDLPDGITFDRVNIANNSGSFEVDAVAARTDGSPSTTDICFTPDTAGVYEVIVTVTDACGSVSQDIGYVTVNLNQPPVADAGADQSVFQCTPQQICLPVSFTDPDNNLEITELVQGPGTLTGSEVCFTPAGTGTYTFVIRAVDSCGLADRDTVVVTVGANVPPVAVQPSAQNVFLCAAEEICYTFGASDANGGTLSWTLISGAGSISTAGEYCFTPGASGSFNATVAVADSCGAADTVTATFNVTLNSAPVAVNPASPVSLSQCTAQEVCVQFDASDADSDPLSWTMVSGDGALSSSGEWCFTPTGSGAYTVAAEVADSCGATDTVSLTYNVEINGAPTIALGADSSLTLCAPQQICLEYSVDDPQGPAGLAEIMISGYGTLDTAANQVCFTPTTSGTYEFVLRVTDPCGAVDSDTIEVSVTFGLSAAIDCPTGSIDVFLCGPDSIHYMLDISPATAVVTVSQGKYENDLIDLSVDTSGTYVVDVIAEEACGSDTCQLVFNVEVGEAPQITCPAPSTKFICDAGATVCIPVGVMGADTNVTVSPIGSYSSGNVCFVADTSGLYTLTMIAATPCGSDTCQLQVDVTVNSAPVADDPSSPVDTFLCANGQLCYDFSASDADGNSLTWAKLSGNGTVSAAGQWCFSVSGSGTYTVTAVVSDPCGDADTTTLTYNVTINSAPVLSLGANQSRFLCAAQQVCLPYTVTDANSNVSSVVLSSGSGVLDEMTQTICFTPAASGNYQFIATATDACGLSSVDTVSVSVTMNQAPIANAGSDQTIFQCSNTPICLPASCSDPNGNLTGCELVNGPAGATYNGTNICFTPTGTWNYEFVIKATDSCGAVDYDTVAVFYTLNSKPVANAGADQTVFQCAPTEICWPAECSDPNGAGDLASCTLVSGPGTYNGTNICFTPSATGVYEFVLEAEDDCGRTDLDTVLIDVTINSAPVCTVPDDTVIFQCTPAEVCLPAFATDADGNLDNCQVNVGTLVGSTWCYTPTSSQNVTVTMTCTDECSAQCVSQFTVEFVINDEPTIAFGADTTLFLCASDEICLPYNADDPNDPRPTMISLISGPGTLDEVNSRVCFTPASAGSYEFVVRIEDECGEFDQDTINVTVGINNPPVADAGADQTLFLCSAGQPICWPVSCSDVDGNLDDCQFTGPGTYNGSTICFTPAGSGVFEFTLRAVDECGADMTDTVTLTVTVNSAPVVTLPADSSVFQCTPAPICIDYTVDDANGLAKVLESMTGGFGTIDTAANQICFTPGSAGDYEFIVSATDSCGAVGADTMTVSVSFGQFASITCPTGPIDVFLCDPDSVCQSLGITPASATVTVSQGHYANGQLCILADTAGTYIVDVIAESSCGADTCQLVFNVDIGEAPQITCPAPVTRFVCDAGSSVCIPVGVMGSGATVSVSPFATYSGGTVCFDADTSGHYEIEMIATTSCGSDTCTIIADITLNSAPVADDPGGPIDTSMCDPAQVCYQFTASDLDGGALTWTKTTGNGSVSAAGLWCFDATASGSYSVTATVTDSCGASDQVTLQYNIDLNNAPVVNLGADTTRFICASEEICLPYIVGDADSNVTDVVLLVGSGTLNTSTNQLCFTPDTAGIYRFIVQATDACGDSDIDTLNVTIGVNRPPVANAGADASIFQCAPTQVCWSASAGDPDGNLDSVAVIAGPGTFSGGQICFTPDSADTYTIILRAVDECGATDIDTVLITVDMNSGPVCQLPNDTTVFQCTPTQIVLPVGALDPDDNLDHCEILSGPGSLVGGNWQFTPTGDQNVTVAIMCIDDCGVTCIDSFKVSIDINNKPVVSAGADTTVFTCDGGQVCRTITSSDPNNNLDSVWIAQGSGTYNAGTGQYCLSVPYGDGNDRTYTTIFAAVDSCGLQSRDTLKISVDFNEPPVIDLPPDFTAFLDQVGELCFSVEISDVDDNLSGYSVSPIGDWDPFTEQLCFDADSTGTYQIIVTAFDNCADTTVDTVVIEVQVDECIHVQIEYRTDVFQGQTSSLDILLTGSGKELGGYDFLIQYDASVLTPSAAHLGALPANCGWEYFQYRHGATGNCGGGCPSGLIQLVAIAETNNGAYHPGCFLDGQIGVLASIDFLVTNDRTLECMFVPVNFYWTSCSDNSMSSRPGDTLWVVRNVFDAAYNNITNHNFGLPGALGLPDDCIAGVAPDKPRPIRCVDYTNGGFKIICADDIDDRGDLNLDNIAYTIADVVMFTNYFIYGVQAFGTGLQIEAATAASDVNADGLSLTVADLVYLIRVVVGDAAPIPKLDPNAAYEADVSLTSGVVTIDNAGTKIGAMYLLLEGNVTPELHPNASGMQMESHFDGMNTRVLVFTDDGSGTLTSGEVLVVGTTRIKEIELGSAEGMVMAANLNVLPTTYTLSQNYPNPFNPTTTIEFTLPVKSKYRLTIFNVLGQQVEQLSDELEAGYHKIEWDAGRYASGVYFYRLTAGEFSATKKMVLLK
ncbi:T9SS type A sorting domain-containing protein [bacterium]|nr:T9SS type A sorting domain-containing protein [bacterium]